MRTLKNELWIDAPINKIWESLAITGKLESFDPTVKKSFVTSKIKSGISASKKVNMLDGKNWFEEKCTWVNINDFHYIFLKLVANPLTTL